MQCTLCHQSFTKFHHCEQKTTNEVLYDEIDRENRIREARQREEIPYGGGGGRITRREFDQITSELKEEANL